MEEMMKSLESMGVPAQEREHIRDYFRDDIDGLTRYVLYLRAMFDDRHEYVD